jgi:alkaline phosphatase D
MSGLNFTRRRVLGGIAGSSVVSLLGTQLAACGSDSGDDLENYTASFKHGVASGDPLADKVILWTRVTPGSGLTRIEVRWEIATDESIADIVHSGSYTTTAAQDFTVKIDASGLAADTEYFYRFSYGELLSSVGRTKTLSQGSVESIKLAAISCANYPAGYFHVYREVANGNYDAIVHLGDYIYEYKATGYASEDAVALGRVVEPLNELLTLDDYRRRYAQYRTDADLQAAHASAPFICVWDDHEVANDAWENGAENHNDGEGLYSDRKMAALQAYFEWLPIRLPAQITSLQRRFTFGDMIDLIMVDTRHFNRERAPEFAEFTDSNGVIDDVAVRAAINEPRNLLGPVQIEWLREQLATSEARWQVLGQQVLMGRMMIPAPVMAAINSKDVGAGLGAINAAVDAKQKAEVDRTPEEQALLDSVVPYNLDAWDSYNLEREEVFDIAAENSSKLIVLAGDTHNAWGNQLRLNTGEIVGAEFATASVSSPGLEFYLGIGDAISLLEPQVLTLLDDLKFVNLSSRGYLDITFTATTVTSNWRFVNSVKTDDYREAIDRNKTATVDYDTLTLTVI